MIVDRDEVCERYLGLIGGASQMGVHFAPLFRTEEHHRSWRLERIGDATVEKNFARRIQELECQLEAANARWTANEAMMHRLDAKEVKLQAIESKLSKQATELNATRNELSRQAAELKQRFEALNEIREWPGVKERSKAEGNKGVPEGGVTDEKVQRECLEASVAVLNERHGSTVSSNGANHESTPNATVHLEVQTQSLVSVPGAWIHVSSLESS